MKRKGKATLKGDVEGTVTFELYDGKDKRPEPPKPERAKVVRSQASAVQIKTPDERTTLGQLQELIDEARHLGAGDDAVVTLLRGYSVSLYAMVSIGIAIQTPPHWRDEVHP